MAALLILKVGSTVDELIPRRGDFDDWFLDGLGLSSGAVQVVQPHRGGALPDPAEVPGVVVTGSAAMVTDAEAWSLQCESWLSAVVGRGVPVLGVCYGHQLLARAFGGAVGDNPNGREVGTARVALTEAGRHDPLFSGLPEELCVQETHTQSVLALPDTATLLARNGHDGAQAFAIGERAWGVQFHPEFDADIVRGYLLARGDELRAAGLDPERLYREVGDSEHGRQILTNFVSQL